MNWRLPRSYFFCPICWFCGGRHEGVVQGLLAEVPRGLHVSHSSLCLQQDLVWCLAARSSGSVNICWIVRGLYSCSSFARTLGWVFYWFTFLGALAPEVWWFQGHGGQGVLYIRAALCFPGSASPPRGCWVSTACSIPLVSSGFLFTP